MEKPKLIWKIVNSLNGIILILYLFMVLHWPLFYRFTLVHIIIMVAIVYGLKSWIELKSNINNPIKSNKSTKLLYFIGGGIFTLGILFKIMHWPGGSISLLVGVIILNISFIYVFFVNDTNKTRQSNPDILDDF